MKTKFWSQSFNSVFNYQMGLGFFGGGEGSGHENVFFVFQHAVWDEVKALNSVISKIET